jgi:hypothetical protein
MAYERPQTWCDPAVCILDYQFEQSLPVIHFAETSNLLYDNAAKHGRMTLTH